MVGREKMLGQQSNRSFGAGMRCALLATALSAPVAAQSTPVPPALSANPPQPPTAAQPTAAVPARAGAPIPNAPLGTFRPMRAADWALTSVGVVSSLAFTLYSQPDHAGAAGPVLFDAAVRDGLRATRADDRKVVRNTSDVLGAATLAYTLADSYLYARHVSGDAGFQRLSISAEAYALTWMITSFVKYGVRRARPYAAPCEANPNYDPHCGDSERFVSFFSQHSSLTATSAGLACAFHALTPHAGPGGGLSACWTGIGLSVAVGVLRIVSDNHWASDVVVGHLVGFGSGFLVPWLAHQDSARNSAGGAQPATWAVIPTLMGRSATQPGLLLAGSF